MSFCICVDTVLLSKRDGKTKGVGVFCLSTARRPERGATVKSNTEFSDDANLIREAKSGNNAARTTLLQQYRPLIDSLAYRYSTGLPEEEREDLAQEAAIAFFNALEQFDPERGIAFGYFAKICISNYLSDYLRKRSKNPAKNAIPFDQQGDLGLGTDDWVSQFFNTEWLKTFFAKLPQILSDQEYHVWMMYFAGQTAKEIANALGKTKKSIESTLARARRKIKDNLPHN